MICAHAPCRCSDTAAVHEGKAYCCEDCARAARAAEPRCPCGHADCGAGGTTTAGSGPREGTR